MSDRAPTLSAGTFAIRDDRDRLFVALAELVAERGYDSVDAADVAARAGLRREDFDRWFDDKDECLVAAFDAVAEQAFAAVAEAFMRTRDDWPRAIQGGLAELLTFVAGTPKLTELCVTVAMRAGSPALERRDEVLERFADFLEPGYAEAVEPPSTVVSEAISGGIYELIRTHVVDGRLDALPDALPQATVIALSPFVGNEHAERLAAGQPTG